MVSGQRHARNVIRLDSNHLNISESHQTNDLSKSPTSQDHFTGKGKIFFTFYYILPVVA